AALADFIEQGYFFRHLNRMRRLYGRRRAVFLGLLAEHLEPWLDPIDGRTGIQLAALFKSAIDDNRVVDRAAAAGINLAPLSVYFASEPRASGLLMGYAGVVEAEMRRLIPMMRDILQDLYPAGGDR
ncbi:MAG: PLP-dependent aminotransferase family protein, partial [Bauldia litoralis]